MKLTANPTNPYIKHNPQTLGDASNCRQGTGPVTAGAAGRLLTINSRSAELSWRISSGRLRNHNQKNTHQAKPRPATSVIVVAQPLNILVINSLGRTCR